CRRCGKTAGQQFQVHHLFYDKSRAYWDYPDEALALLCPECHGLQTQLARWPTALRQNLAIAGLWNEHFQQLAEAFAMTRWLLHDDAGILVEHIKRLLQEMQDGEGAALLRHGVRPLRLDETP